jgi:hypothetical protein
MIAALAEIEEVRKSERGNYEKEKREVAGDKVPKWACPRNSEEMPDKKDWYEEGSCS